MRLRCSGLGAKPASMGGVGFGPPGATRPRHGGRALLAAPFAPQSIARDSLSAFLAVGSLSPRLLVGVSTGSYESTNSGVILTDSPGIAAAAERKPLPQYLSIL